MVKEIAAMWNLSHDAVTRLFRDEEGVFKSCRPKQKGRRKRITLRIPESVMIRVYDRCVKK
jgi:hypothetical protein